jgi:hypothetical protein
MQSSSVKITLVGRGIDRKTATLNGFSNTNEYTTKSNGWKRYEEQKLGFIPVDGAGSEMTLNFANLTQSIRDSLP